MVRHTLKILQQILQDYWSLSDHFGTLCIKGLGKSTLPNLLILFIFSLYVSIQCKCNNFPLSRTSLSSGLVGKIQNSWSFETARISLIYNFYHNTVFGIYRFGDLNWYYEFIRYIYQEWKINIVWRICCKVLFL